MMYRATRLKVLATAYVCDRDRGSEPGNAYRTLEALSWRPEIESLTVLVRHRDAGKLVADSISWNLVPRIVPVADEVNRSLRFSDVTRTYLRYWRWKRAAAKVVAGEEFDVGHHITYGSLSLGNPLARSNKPYLVGPAGGGHPYWRGVVRWLGLKAVAKELARLSAALLLDVLPSPARRGAARSSRVLAVNEHTARRAQRLGAERVDFMLAEGTLPAVPACVQETPLEHRAGFVWVGRMLPIKAPLLAVKAYELYLAGGGEQKLTMLGDGPLLEVVREYVRSRGGLQGMVEVSGRVPHRDVYRQLAKSVALVFSSIRDSSGAQVLEAATCGTPAVMCEWQLMTQWVPKDARWTARRMSTALAEVHSLADALTEASAALNDGRWAQHSRYALEWSSLHAWDTRAAELVQKYREVSGIA
ncbi:glycosyltransferase [Actinomycetospora sp. CA-101289]|uniref:glycosyltransferase n=1 Tax=Actinomycetospora sp. CA-101289 TaxID=3239893 RepID=UPI003D98FE77